MGYEKLDSSDIVEKIEACKSHIRAMEGKMSKAARESIQIPLKRNTAYRRLWRYAIPTVIATIVEVAGLIFLLILIGGIVSAGGGGNSAQGFLMLGGLFLVPFGGYGCVRLWIQIIRLIEFIKDLEFEEASLEAKIDILRIKIEERKAEMERYINETKDKCKEIL